MPDGLTPKFKDNPQANVYRLCVELLQAWDAMQASNKLAGPLDQDGTTDAMEAAIEAIRNHEIVKHRLARKED